MKFCLYALTRKKWNNAFDILKEIISNLESYVQPIFQLNIKVMFRHVGNWNLYLGDFLSQQVAWRCTQAKLRRI